MPPQNKLSLNKKRKQGEKRKEETEIFEEEDEEVVIKKVEDISIASPNAKKRKVEKQTPTKTQPKQQQQQPPITSPSSSKRPPQNKSSSSSNTTTTTTPPTSNTSQLTSLQQEFQEKLKSSKFRFLNEKLYTTTGHQAKLLFEKDPSLFTLYHDGYRQSMEKWPFQPVKNMIKYLNGKPLTWVVADMGCGDAEIAKNAKQKTIHSFDLIAANDKAVACDMRKTPLTEECVDCVIFCLSLMGTNFYDYLREASRICKEGGCLRIAELESRFLTEETMAAGNSSMDYETSKSPKKKFSPFTKFISCVEHFGFKLQKQSTPNGYFVIFEFNKVKPYSETKVLKDPTFTNLDVMKPCIYKRR